MSDKGWYQLAFEDRQKTWKGWLRQFRQHHGRADRPTVWEIYVDGSRVFTRHGLLDGAMQENNYQGKMKNQGRANEISAEEDAIAEARRDCRKKWDFEGYDEYTGNKNLDRRNQDVSIQHLLTSLPGSFCLYKPENNLFDCSRLLKKANEGKALYLLKRDGIAKLVVKDYYGNVQIYSRRARAWSDTEGPTEMPDGTLDYSTVVPWAARFPHLIEAVKNLPIPNGSMMAAELVLADRDDFRYVSGLTKGHTPRSLEDQRVGGYPILYWWDIPFYGGENWLESKTINQRLGKMIDLIAKSPLHTHRWIYPMQSFGFPNPEAAIAYAKHNKFEGFVVVDPDAIYGDKGWNLKGKPDRPSTCAKLKPKFEDDFVAIWDPKDKKQAGTGKHEKGKIVELPNGKKVTHGGVGSVGLFQYNSKGELIKCCNVGSGLDYDFQARLREKDFPMVWQIEYPERTYISDGEDTNALRHPVFLRVRDDKKPEECVNPRLDVETGS